MIVTSDLFERINTAQVVALKEENWKKAYKSKYLIHLGATKMYLDLKRNYWWPELGRKLHMSTTFHPQTDDQSERMIQTLEDMLRACVIDFGGNWDDHLPLEGVGSKELARTDVVLATTKKLETNQERLNAVQDRWKSYADNRRRPIEFNVGDSVLLKVSPWKDDVEIHPEITSQEELVAILGRKSRQLRNKEILLVKVQWKHRKGTSIGWEPEEKMRIGLVQRGLQAQVRVVRTDKGIEFLNQTLHAYFAAEGIQHQTSVARTPEQNSVVERRNCTLVEAARTMLSAAKVPLFFWAEAIATACFTQNHSLVIPLHEKTPYHIINERKPLVKFFYIFGSVCYIVRDGENLDKMKEKGDECIFVGYSTKSRAYRVFNKRTRVIMESIHVNFDELPQMASAHNSSDPAPTCQKWHHFKSVLIPHLNVRQWHLNTTV
uniref:Retrovirus-related Pol polyprotein from transposon TNT 1-94 n=1 Tax=Tanacetum cinerariifolium TaxID=118510 RepID=A0A699I8I9_TANCI|nr:retrovirus-related Pol polyprotein from transposon TNT 1-94 [Tanacetum cinerariifolium]